MRVSIRTWAALGILVALQLFVTGITGSAVAVSPGSDVAASTPRAGPVPASTLINGLPEFPSNLTHFIYIVRENHVFDDYLGDCALDINETCDGGQGWTSPACSSPPCLSDPKSETAASGDQLDVPYLHELARQYSVFDNYYSSVDPYSAQAHAFFFSGTATGTDTGGTCPTVMQGTGAGSEWGDYNTTDVQQGDCGFSTDSGSQTYPSTGTIFDRFTGTNDGPTSATTPPFLTIGDILWELSGISCTHDSFGAIAGGLPGNSEAIDYVTCAAGAGWWTNTTTGSIGLPPVINPTTHTPEMLDVCQYECSDIATYPDEWAANDFISYVNDYGLPTYTFIELFDDHPSSGTTNCGAATQADCIKYNDESMDRIVTDIENGSSPYRNNTVIAIQEDDTQDGENGADHVNNGRRIPLVVVAPTNVMKTGNPDPSSCGIATTGLTPDTCGNVVHETYNTSNILAVMERVEMNVNPSIFSSSTGGLDTFPMVQNDQLAEVNPLEALWKCGNPRTSPYCNTGTGGGTFLTSTAVSPSPISTTPSGTVGVTASTYDNGTLFTGATFTWKINPTSLGTLSSLGPGASTTFTASSSTGSGNICENATYGHVTLMSCAITTVTATLALASVTVSPSLLSVPAGGTSSAITAVALTNTGSQVYQGTSGAVWTWSLSSSADGTLNATTGQPVVFNAGATWGNTTACLNVTWNGGANKWSCTWISISKAPPQLSSVVMTPSSVTLATGTTQTFSITPYNQYGKVMIGPPLGFNFTLTPSSLGSLSSVSQGPWQPYTNFTAGSSAGSGTLSVTVTDGVNIPHSTTSSITVSAAAPLTATFTQTPWHGTAPLTVSIAGSVSGGSGSGYSQALTWGDGSSPSIGSGSTISMSHIYTTAGVFTPSLLVTDSKGNSAQVSLGPVTVYDNGSSACPLKATASGTPLTGTAPLETVLTGGVSCGTPPYTETWTFGDGSAPQTGLQVDHTYASSGTYYASFFANDSAGASAVSTLEVDALAPTSGSPLSVALIGGPPNGTAPLTVSFSASVSGGTAPYTLTWQWGDSTPNSAGISVSHTYTTAGSYTIDLTVEDSAGHSSEYSIPITVTAGPSAPANSNLGPLGISWTEWGLLIVVLALLAVLAAVVISHRRGPKTRPEDEEMMSYSSPPLHEPYASGASVAQPGPPPMTPAPTRPNYSPADDSRAPDPRGGR